MLPLLGAGIGAGVGIGKAIYGGITASKANRDMADLEKNRPVYSRPDEIKQYLEMAKTGYNSQMPGQTQMTQNLQQSTQGMISKLQDSGQLDAGAIQQLYQSEIGAYNNLAMQQGQYHQQQVDRLSQALGESAKYADQEFEYNVNSPWQRKYSRAISKYEAGQEALGQGLSGIANAGMSFASMGSGTGGQQGNIASYQMPATGSYTPSGMLTGGSSQLNTSGMLSIPRY